MPAVPKRRGWLDKEFAEYEIAAIVSAAITRAILSTSDPFTILAIRRSAESPPGKRDVTRALASAVSPSFATSRTMRCSFPACENPCDKYRQTPANVPSHPSSGYGHTSGNECATLEMHQRAVIFVIPMSAAGISAGVPTSVPRGGGRKGT